MGSRGGVFRRPGFGGQSKERRKEGKKGKGRIRAGRQMSSYAESAAVLSGESIESIQREKKRAREGKRERERERERGSDRATPAQLAPPRCKCTCTSYALRLGSYPRAPVGSRFQLPIGIGGIGIGIGI